MAVTSIIRGGGKIKSYEEVKNACEGCQNLFFFSIFMQKSKICSNFNIFVITLSFKAVKIYRIIFMINEAHPFSLVWTCNFCVFNQAVSLFNFQCYTKHIWSATANCPIYLIVWLIQELVQSIPFRTFPFEKES